MKTRCHAEFRNAIDTLRRFGKIVLEMEGAARSSSVMGSSAYDVLRDLDIIPLHVVPGNEGADLEQAMRNLPRAKKEPLSNYQKRLAAYILAGDIDRSWNKPANLEAEAPRDDHRPCAAEAPL